jgi:hypothetical protein
MSHKIKIKWTKFNEGTLVAKPLAQINLPWNPLVVFVYPASEASSSSQELLPCLRF